MFNTAAILESNDLTRFLTTKMWE